MTNVGAWFIKPE